MPWEEAQQQLSRTIISNKEGWERQQICWNHGSEILAQRLGMLRLGWVPPGTAMKAAGIFRICQA